MLYRKEEKMTEYVKGMTEMWSKLLCSMALLGTSVGSCRPLQNYSAALILWRLHPVMTARCCKYLSLWVITLVFGVWLIFRNRLPYMRLNEHLDYFLI